MIGVLLGVLTNGIALATILTFWLSTPPATSSHTVIIRNGSDLFFQQFYHHYKIFLEIPIGTIFLFSGNLSTLNDSVHTWLYCNGSEVSRITYKNLFNVIGEIYGAGDGNKTFNLPDFRSRFPFGTNDSDSTSLVTGGAASHTISPLEMPAHSHDQGTLQTLASGDHVHGVSDPGHNHGGSTGAEPYSGGSYSMNPFGGLGNDIGTHAHTIPVGLTGVSILTAGSHTHTVTGFTGVQGANVPFDMIPPYQTVNYIICAQ